MGALTAEEAVSLFLIKFMAILWEALPFIVLGAILAGILEEFLPQQAITKFLPKQVVPAIMIGGVLGLIFPMCECGIVVVMRRLLRKGLPLSCCIAYMLSGPIINAIVITSTWVAFAPHQIGREVVGMRVGMAFVVACVTAFVVHLQYRRHGSALLVPGAMPPVEEPTQAAGQESDVPAAPRKSLGKRLGNISATAMHDFIDITLFLTIGAALAATAKLFITPQQIESMSREQPFLAIPMMMGLAFLLCLCSEADAFVAASFTKMHVTAKIAFLVFGPMLDIKLVLMYTRVFRRRLILTLITTVTTLVLVLCLLVHLVYQWNQWTGLPPG